MPSQTDDEALDGEIVEATTGAIMRTANTPGAADVESSLIAVLTKAEMDQQITTARAYPRSIAHAVQATKEIACLDLETAMSCGYALPRKEKDGTTKHITGASVRLAEIAAGRWGNCRAESRITDVNRAEGYVEAEGIFHDLETNYAVRSRVRRGIRSAPYKGKPGRLYSDDMITVTGNAAASIAFRNAVFKGIPRPVWMGAYAATQELVRGDAKSLSANRDAMLQAFAKTFGLGPTKVFLILGVNGVEDITQDHLAVGRGFFAGLKNNEITLEDLLKSAAPAAPKPPPGNLADANKPREKAPPADQAKAERDEPTHDPVTGEIPPDDPEEGEAQTDAPADDEAEKGEDDADPEPSDDDAEFDDFKEAVAIARTVAELKALSPSGSAALVKRKRSALRERLGELDAEPGADPWVFDLWIDTAIKNIANEHRKVMSLETYRALDDETRDDLSARTLAAKEREKKANG